ncbi:hypothetical protein HMI56_004579 [Coelomomyces lativittatus]|nr:hypothetical protein HMI56_004579 [Coelomomyces lativittatus]
MPQLNKEESNDSFMVHVSSIEKFFKVENEMEENERKPIGVFANKSVLNPIGDCSNNSHDLVRKVGKEMVQHSISENGIIEQPYAPQLNLNADKNEKLSGKRFTPLEPLPDLKHDFQSVTSSFRVKMVENGMERKEVFDPKTGLVHIVESAPINLNSSHIGHDQHSTQHSTDISAPKSVIENKPTHLSNADNSSSELLSTWLDDEDDAFLASLPMPPSAGHSVTGQKSLTA